MGKKVNTKEYLSCYWISINTNIGHCSWFLEVRVVVTLSAPAGWMKGVRAVRMSRTYRLLVIFVLSWSGCCIARWFGLWKLSALYVYDTCISCMYITLAGEEWGSSLYLDMGCFQDILILLDKYLCHPHGMSGIVQGTECSSRQRKVCVCMYL